MTAAPPCAGRYTAERMVYGNDDNRNVLLLISLGAEKLLLLLVSSKCVLLLLQWCSIYHTREVDAKQMRAAQIEQQRRCVMVL